MPFNIEHFQYQVKTEPVLATPEQVTESRWHEPWSEPVRVKIDPRLAIALAASGLFFTPQTFGEIVLVSKWFSPLSEPIRIKPALGTGSQSVLAFHPSPVVPFSYYNWLSEPVRIKLGVRAEQQHALEYDPFPFTNMSWYDWLSEPVRLKPGLRPEQQQFVAYQTNPSTVTPFAWYANLADPVRLPQRLLAGANPFFFYGSINPLVSFGYYNWLSEPVRIRLRTPPGAPDFSFGDERPLVNFSYFNWLSEPVRLKPRLLEGLQEFLARASFIPINYSASLNATEQGDFLQAVLYQFNVAITALVDIITNDPSHRGNMGIIAPLQQSSIVTAIIEPNSVQATGIVSPVVAAGARVAIITGP